MCRHTALLSASTSGLQLESILSSLSLSQSIHICSFSSRARSRSRPANNRGDDSLEAAPDALSFDSSLERLKGKYGHLNNARSQSREVYGTAGRSGSGMESMLRGARTGPSSLEMSAYLSMLISQLNELQDAEALLAMHAASMRPAHFVELQARLPQLDASGGNAGMRMRAMTRYADAALLVSVTAGNIHCCCNTWRPCVVTDAVYPTLHDPRVCNSAQHRCMTCWGQVCICLQHPWLGACLPKNPIAPHATILCIFLYQAPAPPW